MVVIRLDLPDGGVGYAQRDTLHLDPMTPDSTLAKVLCLVVLAVLAMAAGYAIVMSLTNYSAIGV
jgi:hypothetical protein